VLQCVAVCCSVLQCVAMWCNVMQCVVVCFSVWLTCSVQNRHVAVCCSVLQYVAVCCSVLQCVAVCGWNLAEQNRYAGTDNEASFDAIFSRHRCPVPVSLFERFEKGRYWGTAVGEVPSVGSGGRDDCRRHMRSRVCEMLQRAATHYNVLQHAATFLGDAMIVEDIWGVEFVRCCDVLQHTATYCNTLHRFWGTLRLSKTHEE